MKIHPQKRQEIRGHLVSRPMTLRVDHFDGTLLLFAPADSRAIANITANPKVDISHRDPTTSLSIAATATFTPNPERVSAHWHRGLDPWFPCGTEDAAMIELTVDEARFWTFAGQRLSSLRVCNGMRQVDVAGLV
jgi:general stress protein 26